MNRTLKKLVGGKKSNDEETDQEFDEHRKQCEALLTIMDALRKQAKRFLDLCNELGPSMLAMAQSFERLYAEGADKVCGSKIMMAALRMDMASKDFQNETGQAVSRLERFYEVLHTQKKRLKQHDNYLSTYKKSVSALKSARSSGDPIRVERAEEKHKEAQRDYEQSHAALRTSLIRCNTKRTFFVNKSFTQIAKGSFQLFTASKEGVSMLEPVLDYSPTGEPLSPEDEADEDMQQAANSKNNSNNKPQPPREDNAALSSTMTRMNPSAFSFSSSNPRRRSTTFSPTSSTPTTSGYTNPTNASTRVVSPLQRPVSTAYCNNFAFGDQPSRSPPLPPPSSSSYRQPQQPQPPQLPRPPTFQPQQYPQYQPSAPHHQPLPPRTSASLPGFGPQQHHHHHHHQPQPQQPNYSAAPTSSPLGLPPQLPPAPHRQAPPSSSSAGDSLSFSPIPGYP